MEMLAGEWWQNVDVWAIVASSVIALLVGWLGAWATLRSGRPKRAAVQWWESSNTSLFTSTQYIGESGPLTVQLGTTRLEKPRIIELFISNVGDHDITAGMFHEGAALRFSFGSPVLLILEYDAAPAADLSQVIHTYTEPSAVPLTVAAGGIEFRPTLLRRGQSVMVTALVDGEYRATQCTNFPLVDVEELHGIPMVEAPSSFVDGVIGAVYGGARGAIRALIR